MTLRPTFEGTFAESVVGNDADKWLDITACETVLFEWAESYDGKDWERLERCIAPSLRVCRPLSI